MPNEINQATRTMIGNDDATVLKPKRVDTGLQVGMTLKNRFVLENILGQGGMGTIFKARDLLKEEMGDRKPFVAIKVLHPKLQKNSSLIRALQREARKSQELAHPNIVNVHDFDRDGQYVFMVMECLQGKPLNTLISEGLLENLPLRERWSMIEKIGRGIAYAHEKKVIHYDIKPGNVFICDDGETKILDFGIAKARRSTAEENMTVFDQYSPDALTPAYATCEMLRWETPDVRDDIYAFGCVAYEILTGNHPFNKMPALKALKDGLSPPPIKGLSKGQWKAIKSALELKREDRIANIVDFLKMGTGVDQPGAWNGLKYLTVGVGIVVVASLGIWKFMPANPNGEIDPPLKTPEFVFVRTGPPPAPELQETIDRILTTAESHFSVGRIVEPPGTSAADAYQSVLDLDPESPEARLGMVKAMQYCEQEVRNQSQNGKLEQAMQMIELCLYFEPNHPALKQLRTELETQP